MSCPKVVTHDIKPIDKAIASCDTWYIDKDGKVKTVESYLNKKQNTHKEDPVPIPEYMQNTQDVSVESFIIFVFATLVWLL